jgi:4-hydroxy-tetrahydrodipicolinate synthase
VRPNRPDFSFMTGWDCVLMPMLLVGCDGGTNATSGVTPEWTRRLYDLCVGGMLDEARALQYKLRRLFDLLLYTADFPEACRVAVGLRGLCMGPGRQPLSDQHRAKLDAVEGKLRQLFDEEGLSSNAPAAASVPMPPVHQIVESVLAALRDQGVVGA